MTELTFAILKYSFLALLWIFVWLAVRGLHNDVKAGLSRHGGHRRGSVRPAQPQVLVGGSGPSLLDDQGTPADQAQSALVDQSDLAGPAVSDLAPAAPAAQPGGNSLSGQGGFPGNSPAPAPAPAPARGDQDGPQGQDSLQEALDEPDASPAPAPSQDARAQNAIPTQAVAQGAAGIPSAPQAGTSPAGGYASPDDIPAEPPAPARRPLSGTTDPVSVDDRRDVLGSLPDLPSNPGQDNASESADLASLVAGVASEKRERTNAVLPVPTMLTIIDGPRAGSAVTLEGPAVTLGRAGDNTVVLDDEYVSGHHCRLVPAKGGQWRLEDLGSTNGTYVNESRLRAPAVIPVGTPVRIGATTFTLR